MHVKITSPSGLGAETDVELDGKKSAWLTAVKFEAAADRWATVELALLSQGFEFDGEAKVAFDKETAELLVKLGWTPPKADADGDI